MFENNFPYGNGGGFNPSFPTMPNNGFNQQGYTPTYPNMQNTAPAAQTKPQSNMDWIHVNTVEDVDRVSVQPNGKAWVMINNDSLFALKTADNLGVYTTELYRFERVNGSPAPKQVDYLTREEVMNMIDERIKELTPAKTATTKKGGKSDD